MSKLALVFASAVTLLSIAGCKKKAGDGGGQDSSAARAKMTELKDKLCACKDADCAMKVSDEVTEWSATQAKAGAGKQVSQADKKQLDDTAMQIADCMQRFITHGTGSSAAAGSGSAVGSGSAAGAVDGGSAASGPVAGLPKQCDDYKAAIDKLATCEALPKEARETLTKGYSEAAAGWKALPDAAKEKVGVSCEAGAKAVIAAASGPCGWK